MWQNMKIKSTWLKSRLTTLDRVTEVQHGKKDFAYGEFKYLIICGNVITD